MEYIIVAVAAMLAGIGTGLVGLSAATAMVPLLIVLCPTFGGEHGAFMATAIALASDILGSAVTSFVYAKNKKIDLKHGWLLLSCVVFMCTLGSAAAYFTHQSVLGNFSLFLCVAIGIRFLVKPDSKDKPDQAGSVRLTAKEIAVSLFFGLTIGFGTGFFGSGGGMMMLIVFTAMLGYDRRTAVGTSTFIMTFTALIASVSHILMEPAILLECWDYLLLSIVIATFFSLVSARFANRVNARAVGLVTGVTLLTLGLAMILLNNISRIDMAAVTAVLVLFGKYMAYIIAAASLLLILRCTVKVPDFLFRKLLHIVAFTSILPAVLWADSWQQAAAVKALFLVVIIIGLTAIERLPFYKSLFVEKGKHEVLVSFILLFSLMALLIGVFWGVLGDAYRYIPIAAIMAWGPGDGAAAICGRLFGRHKLQGRMIEGVKSVEGSIAMALTSFCCTLPVLLIMSGMSVTDCLLLSLVIAPVSALTELFTKHGLDTVTVPIAASIILGLAAML
ncbi:MAG: TSUP family transporter [Clostridia bacterium]|nr:TSUP family transporter [Clostridia bacterium]